MSTSKPTGRTTRGRRAARRRHSSASLVLLVAAVAVFACVGLVALQVLNPPVLEPAADTARSSGRPTPTPTPPPTGASASPDAQAKIAAPQKDGYPVLDDTEWAAFMAAPVSGRSLTVYGVGYLALPTEGACSFMAALSNAPLNDLLDADGDGWLSSEAPDCVPADAVVQRGTFTAQVTVRGTETIDLGTGQSSSVTAYTVDQLTID